jgi:nucleoside-diphosphate-sugar epimerase
MDRAAIRSVLSAVKPDAVVDFMSYGTSAFAARSKQLLDGTGHYCFLSSYRVFADSSPAALTERSPRLLDVCSDTAYLATDEYALAKARQEDMLRACGRTHWTILRPCITYSRTRFQLGTLEANTVCYRALHGLPIVMAREILARQTTMTWAGDVAKMIARLVLNEFAFAEDYNVVTAEHHSWAQVAAYYQQALQLQIRDIALDDYIRLVGGAYQIKYDRLFDRVMDNSKVLAIARMHQANLMPLSIGLPMELQNFRQCPCFHSSALGLNARMDRATGTRLPLAGHPVGTRIKYFIERYPPLKRVCSLVRAALPRLYER